MMKRLLFNPEITQSTYNYCKNKGNGIYSSEPCHFGYSDITTMRNNESFNDRLIEPHSFSTGVTNEEELKQNCDALGKDCKIAVYKKPDNPDELGIGVYYNNGIDFTVTTNDVDQPFNIYENKNVDATNSDFLLDRHEITVLNGKLFHRRNNKCNSDSLKVSQSDDVVIMTESFKLSSNALMTQYQDRIHIYDGTLDLRHYSDSGEPPRGRNEWINRPDQSGPGIAYKNITTSSNYILEFDINPENSIWGWNSVNAFY